MSGRIEMNTRDIIKSRLRMGKGVRCGVTGKRMYGLESDSFISPSEDYGVDALGWALVDRRTSPLPTTSASSLQSVASIGTD